MAVSTIGMIKPIVLIEKKFISDFEIISWSISARTNKTKEKEKETVSETRACVHVRLHICHICIYC